MPSTLQQLAWKVGMFILKHYSAIWKSGVHSADQWAPTSTFQTSTCYTSTALYFNREWLKFRAHLLYQKLCRSTALNINQKKTWRSSSLLVLLFCTKVSKDHFSNKTVELKFLVLPCLKSDIQRPLLPNNGTKSEGNIFTKISKEIILNRDLCGVFLELKAKTTYNYWSMEQNKRKMVFRSTMVDVESCWSAEHF